MDKYQNYQRTGQGYTFQLTPIDRDQLPQKLPGNGDFGNRFTKLEIPDDTSQQDNSAILTDFYFRHLISAIEDALVKGEEIRQKFRNNLPLEDHYPIAERSFDHQDPWNAEGFSIFILTVQNPHDADAGLVTLNPGTPYYRFRFLKSNDQYQFTDDNELLAFRNQLQPYAQPADQIQP